MSKLTYRLYGKIVNGTEKFYTPDLYATMKAELEGKEFEMTLKERHYNASTDQYGYYHAGIIEECLRNEMFGGWTHDDVDNFFSEQFLTIKKSLQLGEITYIVPERLSKGNGFSKKEMTAFIEKCLLWCAENGIQIKSPEEYYLGRYKTINK